MLIIDESKKDDKIDADGDGVADTKQIDGKELVKRKVKLVLTKMDPEKVNTAIASIYKGMYASRKCYGFILPVLCTYVRSIGSKICFYTHCCLLILFHYATHTAKQRYSLDECIGRVNYSICKDNCVGFDYC